MGWRCRLVGNKPGVTSLSSLLPLKTLGEGFSLVYLERRDSGQPLSPELLARRRMAETTRGSPSARATLARCVGPHERFPGPAGKPSAQVCSSDSTPARIETPINNAGLVPSSLVPLPSPGLSEPTLGSSAGLYAKTATSGQLHTCSSGTQG